MRLKLILAAAVLAGPAVAEDAMIRVEAVRAAQVEQALARWRTEFPDAVAVPQPGSNWTVIAVGPQDASAAADRMAGLKSEGKIPADSYLTAPDGRTRISVTAEAASPAPVSPPIEEAPASAAITEAAHQAEAETEAATNLAAEPAQPAAETPPPAPWLAQSFIRLRALQDRAEAEAALTEARAQFPQAGLWALPDGWFALALGPMDAEAASAWTPALKQAEAIASDAFATTGDKMGEPLDMGSGELPAPPAAPVALPPLDQAQQALRWAGFYDGTIDGKDGPKTRSAIAREIAAAQISTDPGTALAALIERRTEWRNQIGLENLDDPHSGLSLTAPLDRIVHRRDQGPFSIYGPKDSSDAALILIADQGDAARVQELAGMITALGWVPEPQRHSESGRLYLSGANTDYTARAELIRDGQSIRGFVLIWPLRDAANLPRIAAEIEDSLRPTPQPEPEPETETAAPAEADSAGN
ncbi:MAG: peptidoglycan-binding protein [Paracoccus sp. (in: a-proteobacteria)]|uniref:peptidoglycan-binding domain-containing protein n=1 Tax=Paracoccus sp. TaxID=267 RepID=UPI0026E0D461|nr:peptidoglycan-binding protein [Paracoccus sp. (in: a-proteobacteria)]MDO5621317.1 peptidoglycan-binding protein [Paracoccus sp. (in: a-proteobacteria)]